jgi:hypothetical protein
LTQIPHRAALARCEVLLGVASREPRQALRIAALLGRRVSQTPGIAPPRALTSISHAPARSVSGWIATTSSMVPATQAVAQRLMATLRLSSMVDQQELFGSSSR